MTSALLVRQLRKTFRTRKGAVEAVRGVDLTVESGEIFGFLGPNGAGKSTTLRMLATLLQPDGGEAIIAGIDLSRRPSEVRRHIGYVAQAGGTWFELTAREELSLQARMHGFSRAEAARRAASAIEGFDLTEFADRRCKTYSGGQRRRVDIALGIVHRPQLVFLDEPTAGLDPHSRSRLWQEVRRLRTAGMTVFLTTHYLDEADALCDRLAIIDHGRIVAEGTPEALKREIAADIITVDLNGKIEVAARLLGSEPYVHRMEQPDGGGLRLHVDAGARLMPNIVRALDRAGVEPISITVRRPSLDDIFLAKTGRSLSSGGRA